MAIYKYIPSRFVEPFVRHGHVLFRSLSYFRQQEDKARGDETEGLHIDDPDNEVTITTLSTGHVEKGDFRFLNSIDQGRVFGFCASRTLSDALFDDFACDACIAILDPAVFFLRCETAARRIVPIEPPGLIHGPVEYFWPNMPATMSVKNATSMLSMRTAVALATPVATPRIPAMNARVCVPAVPIRIVLASAATPALPIAMLSLPVVKFRPAFRPRGD